MKKTKILIVEDESLVTKDIQKTLEGLGYEVPAIASSGEAAIQKAEENKPDLMLMDIVLKGRMDGIEAAQEIHARFNIPVVYLTAYTDQNKLERAKVTEPFGYIVKPFKDRELKSVIEMALYKAKTEEELKRANREWSRTFNAISDLVFIQNENYIIIKINKAFADALKSTPENIIGKKCYRLLHKKDTPWSECPFETTKIDKKSHTQEIDDPNIGIPLLVTTSPIFNDKGELAGVVHIAKDISEIKKVNERLKASLKEKEILLEEVHHRVKNNLQVISSLLNLQARYIKDKKILAMFKESQSRISSMGLIHERLYRSKDLVKIDFAEYARSLAAELFSSYAVNSDDITLEIDLKDVPLELDLAIPCGLILNELLSNSLKYAFPKGREGKIKVSLYEVNQNEIELMIGDNGIGLPEEFDFRKTKSLGFQIIATLVEDQLEGKIELDRIRGTEFRIQFKKSSVKKRT